jgi:RNA polymerase sigma-70 factor (ECF subfamily)
MNQVTNPEAATDMSDEEASDQAKPVQSAASAAPGSGPEDARRVSSTLERDGRQAAAELLVNEHAAAVGRICMALLGSQPEAASALQETLAAALRALASGPCPSAHDTLRGWLFSIARRKCAAFTETSNGAREKKPGSALKAGDVAADPTERLKMAVRARRLLADIRPTEREALVLRFAGELSYAELAAACGTDERTARERVSRGIYRLQTLLGEAKS